MVWRPQLVALSDEFTVVAWDEPGAGRSSDVPADFGLADYAYCLAALIAELALGPAHVVGVSWGGTVVQELYRNHPELVATAPFRSTGKEATHTAECRVHAKGKAEVAWHPASGRADRA